jgi:hypothetical protein
MNPSSTAFASVIVITGTTIVRRMREKGWQTHIMEIVVFGFILLIALLTLAIVIPPAALILGWLGMVGAFVVNGPAVFSLLGSFGKGKGAV